MKILILSWRDILNPKSGGAEVLTHEIAKRWIKKGNSVVLFTSTFPGSKKEEAIDGVKIVRRGNPDARYFFLSVHFLAAIYYAFNKNRVDVVVDEIHGLPFFTPFYVRKKKIALICEVAHEVWDINFNFPFNKIGKFIEKQYFNFYKKIPFLTISNSTKEDLISMGVKPDLITVIPMGATYPVSLNKFDKELKTTLLFVGRLTKAKGIEDAMIAVSKLISERKEIQFWIVGRGDEKYEKTLHDKARKLNIAQNTKFFGFVSEQEKFELMSKSHLLIVPSIKEGWGLIVVEAGFCNTPSIVYNVPGLRDIVQDGYSGTIVERKPDQIVNAVKKAIDDKSFYRKIQKGAHETAMRQSWDNSSEAALDAIKK